jgi:hypothetical protein
MALSTYSQSAPHLSKLADPGARSFLTLTSEIRNGVFEALFRVDGPIKIVKNNYERRSRHLNTTNSFSLSFLTSC